MRFDPGDTVHWRGIGTGVVREARSGNRYLVEIKGRLLLLTGDHLERAQPPRARKPSPPEKESGGSERLERTLDLHGRTVSEAVEELDAFLNEAILAGATELRIIHGIGRGQIKTAVHRHLTQLNVVRAFALDARNPGVTVVRL